MRAWISLLLLSACEAEPADDRDGIDEEPAWCEGATRHLYDAVSAEDVLLFPDGLQVREDPASPTGERVDITTETAPWLAEAPAMVRDVLAAMNTLSGFGGLGGVVLRFDGPVDDLPATIEESLVHEGWIWADLGTTPPTRIPFEVQLLDGDATVVLWPAIPLRTGTRHAVVVTTAARDVDGGCLTPSATTRSLLHGSREEGALTERFERVRPRYREAVGALGLTPSDVSALTVFGTHDDLGPMRRAAEAVIAAPVAWGAWLGCEDREQMRQCEATTTVLDYRSASGEVDDTVTPSEQEVPVTVWLPRDAEGPVPIALFGHGLQSRRQDGWEVAKRIQASGVAVIAMPALQHGEHPSVDPEDTRDSLLRFLSVDVAGVTIAPRKVRGHFDQTNLDRLRLLELLRSDPDLDGDGVDDIDPDRVGYIGASLGAALGPGLLALDPELDVAALTIGGGRLTAIVRDQLSLVEQYAPFLELALGEGRLPRLIPILQHAADPSDPATWAPHVVHDRFDGRTPPSVLLAVGLEDEVFSVDSGNTLARALGLPHVGPVVRPVPLLPFGGEAPVAGNAADGDRTLGFFQYDRITSGDDPAPQRPTHGASARSHESGLQIRTFSETWLDGGAPEIVDPFEVLGTPPRPEDW